MAGQAGDRLIAAQSSDRHGTMNWSVMKSIEGWNQGAASTIFLNRWLPNVKFFVLRLGTAVPVVVHRTKVLEVRTSGDRPRIEGEQDVLAVSVVLADEDCAAWTKSHS